MKLVKNFRSHPSILKFPNDQFYGGDLEPCAQSTTIDSFLRSPFLPDNPLFPVVFHAVSGQDDREASSPSFFNVDEVLQVKAYVQQLKESKPFRASKLQHSIYAFLLMTMATFLQMTTRLESSLRTTHSVSRYELRFAASQTLSRSVQ